MQSEDFDKKIQDAAERHHPAYDEKAWMKMEQLLDEHMPVEKERKRRFLLILFFFLLLGGGAFIWFGTGYFSNGSKTISQANEKGSGHTISKQEDTSGLPEANNDQHDKVATDNNNQKELTRIDPSTDKGQTDIPVKKNQDLAISKNKQKDNTSIVPAETVKKERLRSEKRTAVNKEKKIVEKERTIANNRKKVIKTKDDQLNLHKIQEDPILKAIQPDPVKPLITEDKLTNEPVVKNKDQKNDAELTHTKFAPIDALDLSEMKLPKTTKLSRKKGIFFLAASVEPDLSVVGLKEVGKIRTAYGFGLGYTRGRVTLRSGLYVARKVYEAYPDDYKAPAAFYTRYPNLQEVKADCKVYEIPLLLSYDLKRNGNNHWFLTTGLSSYLMKRETYDYYYRWNISDPLVHRERTITNANQHYFSVVTLAAGYQRPLTKKISLVAEPYIKMPLTGIGFGKVKLNSAGVMVSLTYKPFGSMIRK